MSGCNAIDRYYRLKINSLLDCENEDIDAINKFAARDIHCSKCGSRRDIIYRDRKYANRDLKRKHCRYLRANIVEICDNCDSEKKLKLIRHSDSKARTHSKNLGMSIALNSDVVKGCSGQKQSPVVKTGQTRTPAKKIIKKGPKVPQIPASSKTFPQFGSRLKTFSFLLKE